MTSTPSLSRLTSSGGACGSGFPSAAGSTVITALAGCSVALAPRPLSMTAAASSGTVSAVVPAVLTSTGWRTVTSPMRASAVYLPGGTCAEAIGAVLSMTGTACPHRASPASVWACPKCRSRCRASQPS